MKALNVKITANCAAASIKSPGELDTWQEEHIVAIKKSNNVDDVIEACTRWFLSEKWSIYNIKGSYTTEEAGIDLQDIINEYMNN